MSAIPCRLLIDLAAVDAPANGPWNMALDEALLEAAGERGECTLRFYNWSQPTLSLGYFQHCADRKIHPASANCAVVRRSSGGGAILHDRELTYSLALPLSSPLAKDATRLYQAVHGVLIDWLAAHDVAARLNDVTGPAGDDAPFLCFERRAVGDLLVGQHKIAGSAQRRHRQALLQHGSILFARSPAAPELPGLADLTDFSPNIDQVASELASPLASALGLELNRSDLTPESPEHCQATELKAVRYGHADWTHRR